MVESARWTRRYSVEADSLTALYRHAVEASRLSLLFTIPSQQHLRNRLCESSRRTLIDR